MSIGSEVYTVADFGVYLSKGKKAIKRQTYEAYAYTTYRKYIEEMVKNFAARQLDYQYPDFKNIMQEYHDGILLFDLTDKLVWSKASQDTVGLEAFFAQNRSNYKWENRVDAMIFTCDSAVADAALKMVRKNSKKNLTQEEYAKALCDSTNRNCITIDAGKFEKEDKAILSQVAWKAGVSPMLTVDGRKSFVLIKSLVQAENKALDEARGLVIADYQNQLEKQWIESLRTKYKVAVDSAVLESVKSGLVTMKN